MDTYNTITQNSEALYKEKGSKFIGYAFPVKKHADIDNALLLLKEQHPKATHHCYAYKLGIEEPETRANDDGEPSSSAGKPILGQIESAELTNIFIVVVRYYGGTKLGVGGLQTAYKAAAKLAIEENELVTKEIPCYHTIQFPFDQQGIVDHLLKTTEGTTGYKKFTQQVLYKCIIPKANETLFLDRIKAERGIQLIKES